MLTDSQPTNATSSFEMSRHDARALKDAPRGEERRRMQVKIICSPSVDANTHLTPSRLARQLASLRLSASHPTGWWAAEPASYSMRRRRRSLKSSPVPT
jgi:hypothetical protein